MTNYMEDLVILDEDDSRPETQRWAVCEVTNSFEQVFDGNNYHNIDEEVNTQNANNFCRLNRSWYIDAHPDEIKEDLDFRQVPEEVQALITQEIAEAAKTPPANKKPKMKAKRKAKGKGEVTKLNFAPFCKAISRSKNC